MFVDIGRRPTGCGVCVYAVVMGVCDERSRSSERGLAVDKSEASLAFARDAAWKKR